MGTDGYQGGKPKTHGNVLGSQIESVSADAANGGSKSPDKKAPANPKPAQPATSENAATKQRNTKTVDTRATKSALTTIQEKQAGKKKEQDQEVRLQRWRFGRGKTPTPWDEDVTLEDKSLPWSDPANFTEQEVDTNG